MNKSILMSIQPKWLVKILKGYKTIEIRKTMPKCELPIDVYLYCTKDNKLQWLNGQCFPIEWGQCERNKRLLDKTINGKVVAKFTLNKVEVVTDNFGLDEIDYDYRTEELEEAELLKKSCLTIDELFEYMGWEEKGYAWHIDNLVIFDKSMELNEFGLKRAPESYCYIEID